MIDTTPYLTHPYVGLGCWNLVRTVYADVYSILLPDYDNLKIEDELRTINENMTYWRGVADGEHEGDVILFCVARRLYHVGIVLPRKRFLHVRMKECYGSVELYTRPEWARRIEGFYRHVSHCPDV